MSDTLEDRNPSLRWTGVCLDCADAEALADFYGRLLGWEVTGRDGADWISMRDPAGGVGLLFQAPIQLSTSAEEKRRSWLTIRTWIYPICFPHGAPVGIFERSRKPLNSPIQAWLREAPHVCAGGGKMAGMNWPRASGPNWTGGAWRPCKCDCRSCSITTSAPRDQAPFPS